MAITDKEKGVWGLDQVYNKINQGSIWEYTTSGDAHSLWAWGKNTNGMLGQNESVSPGPTSSPKQIPGSWTMISGGHHSGAAVGGIKVGGELYTWGGNNDGTLGLTDRINRSSPAQIPGTTWNSITGGHAGMNATKTDGTLWCWGNNQYGNLGLTNRTRYSSPVQVPGTTWDKFDAGSGSSFVVITKTDGTLWSWGYNAYGMLGQNDTTTRSSPVQVGSDTDWGSSLKANSGFVSQVIKSDGTLWAWGWSGLGQLAQNDTVNRSSPVQIPGTTWKSISGSYYTSAATKTDGTLWTWGRNEDGSLGINVSPTISYSSPTQVPGTNWNEVSRSGGMKTFLATKTDGTLWAWGDNSNAQLGDNSKTDRSSPVQVGSETHWVGETTTCGENASFGLTIP